MALITVNTKKLLPPEAILRFQGGSTSLTLNSSKSAITLDASSSNDPDGTIAAYIWEVKVGTEEWIVFNSTTSNITQNIVSVSATYKYRVKVIDNDFLETYSNEITLIYTNTSPSEITAFINGSSNNVTINALRGSNVILNASDSSSPGSKIVFYTWEMFTSPDDFSLRTRTSRIATFNAIIAGTYVFFLEVIDIDGNTDTNKVTIILT